MSSCMRYTSSRRCADPARHAAAGIFNPNMIRSRFFFPGSRVVRAAWAIALGAELGLAVFAAGNKTTIRFDTVGYLLEHEKRASIAASCSEFAVVRVGDGARVVTGTAKGPMRNADTDEDLWTVDFSAVREPGEYRLEVSGVGGSAPFRVGADVYDAAFRAVTRGMYLWRCGTAVRGEYGGDVFVQAACHLEDAWLDFVTGKHEQQKATGGWHDAGDYNKYVVNAGVTVGAMLQAWKDFEPAVRGIALNLPASGGPLPEFLAEIKWELDWLLAMQAPDGAVYHKLTTENFGGFIRPEAEKTPRYFTPAGTAAAADFVAMLAAGARAMEPFDPSYAERCQSAARKSYAYLQENPADQSPDLSKFKTGAYQTPDPDERLWAAAEVWETTGDGAALRDFETRVRALGTQWDENFDWGNVKNFGLITYLRSTRPGRDASLVAELRDNLVATANAIVAKRDSHGYARPLGTMYYWGGNGGVARQTLILQAAHRVAPNPKYVATALDALHHLFGRNVHGRSYVTGIGYLPPLKPHDRRSGADDVEAPWPGYLVGGANPKAADWYDVQNDFRTNEIAINWNGALIYALAWAISVGER